MLLKSFQVAAILKCFGVATSSDQTVIDSFLSGQAVKAEALRVGLFIQRFARFSRTL
jgi:hypothetical protein